MGARQAVVGEVLESVDDGMIVVVVRPFDNGLFRALVLGSDSPWYLPGDLVACDGCHPWTRIA